ncbi:sepiapterin reductase [Aphanomyces astaci]|uniref:Sepiapterin reductase n=1 Tax=Aphanomyces astaci TaxID=112090 RepID=W4FHP8_APHAT|nr:sepiapterin reductase [Aphanomyces astaci]ETV66985.1 sepiapterin reductase [Aphanomyces astaci]|eukprot:XP_009843502.1 sepiapterin reductase [Aphanomyces astaci]
MAWVVLVTGGSRGFGRALALAFAANKASADDGDLHLYLWSRDAAGMAATAADVTAAWQRQTSHSIHVTQTVVDLSDDSTYGPAIDTFLEEAQVVASVDRVVVVHNAGSLGQVGRIAEVASPQVIRRHMELNVNSVLWINKRQDQMSILRLTIVNISRLLQMYGTQAQAARAARDMHFRVVATEEDTTRVKCLNFAPGPMQTEMGNEIRDGPATDPALQRMFKKLQADGTYVDVNVSAQLCVSHVFGPTLVSGTHVDYYDIYQG